MDSGCKEMFQRYKTGYHRSPYYGKSIFQEIFFNLSASNHTIVGALLHKNDQNVEHPIEFLSKVLRDGKLKYDIMERQAYSLVKYLKYFRVYFLHSCIFSYVPSSVVKGILTQPNPKGKREKWIVVLLEYDIEVNPPN